MNPQRAAECLGLTLRGTEQKRTEPNRRFFTASALLSEHSATIVVAQKKGPI